MKLLLMRLLSLTLVHQSTGVLVFSGCLTLSQTLDTDRKRKVSKTLCLPFRLITRGRRTLARNPSSSMCLYQARTHTISFCASKNYHWLFAISARRVKSQRQFPAQHCSRKSAERRVEQDCVAYSEDVMPAKAKTAKSKGPLTEVRVHPTK